MSEVIAVYRLLAAWLLRLVSPDGRPALPLPDQARFCNGGGAARVLSPAASFAVRTSADTPGLAIPILTPPFTTPHARNSTNPAQVPREFATLPEWFVEDMAEALLSASRYAPHTLASARLDDMMLFLVGHPFAAIGTSWELLAAIGL